MLSILKEAAIEAGAVLKKHFHKNEPSYAKGSDYNIVTPADKESQQIIIDSISKNAINKGLKRIGFICEENFESKGEYTFIVDPLDGTGNYAVGVDYFCVSLAVMFEGKILASVVYDVMGNDFYWAVKGEGAHKNNTVLHFNNSPAPSLRQTLVVSTFPSEITARIESLQSFMKVLPLFRSFRVYGALALDMCRTVNTKTMVLSFGPYIWDIAAASLFVEEARGKVLTWNGSPLDFDLQNSQKHYYLLAGEEKILQLFIDQKIL